MWWHICRRSDNVVICQAQPVKIAALLLDFFNNLPGQWAATRAGIKQRYKPRYRVQPSGWPDGWYMVVTIRGGHILAECDNKPTAQMVAQFLGNLQPREVII